MTEIKIVPSGRIDYCSNCESEHGYECPLDKFTSAYCTQCKREHLFKCPLRPETVTEAVENLKSSLWDVFEKPLLWLMDRLINILQWIDDKLKKYNRK